MKTKTNEKVIDEFQIDENQERGNWTGKLDFLLSCLGYAVGLGNVWRFPYLCYKYGGGAFLIPYVIMLFFIGIPAFFLELFIGQYAAMGPVTVFTNMAPLFKGLGVTNFLSSAYIGLYYNMIIAWTIYYFFASFNSKLPWADCNNDFNSDFCFSIDEYKKCLEKRKLPGNEKIIYHMGRCITNDEDRSIIRLNLSHFYGCQYVIKEHKNPDDLCSEVVGMKKIPGIYINESVCVPLDAQTKNNLTQLFDIPFKIRKTAAAEYLDKSVFNVSSGLSDMGPIQWHLALCLLAAWIVIFICLIKGIKSSGKVVYFTATFPYLVLVILLIRAVTLPGAYNGIHFYMVPEWSKLSDIKVWEGAAIQIFFSLSVAGGGLITLSSYNKFYNNILRDTFIVCFGNCLTSVFAGFCIFSVLGFLASELGVEVKDVVQSGTGLAFVVYPDLVTRLPISPLWAFLFFSMLFTLGLDSQFAIIETLITAITDLVPRWRSKQIFVVAAVCSVGFICGLPLATRGGSYLLELLDFYGAGWPFLFTALSEFILISYVYGIDNFLDDLKHIINFKPSLNVRSHIIVLYSSIAPLLLLFVLILSWAAYTPLTKGDYVYEDWANAIGWILAMIAILAGPVVAVYLIIKKIFFEHGNKSWNEKWRLSFEELTKSTPEWRENANRARMQENQHDEPRFANVYDNNGMSITDNET